MVVDFSTAYHLGKIQDPRSVFFYMNSNTNKVFSMATFMVSSIWHSVTSVASFHFHKVMVCIIPCSVFYEVNHNDEQ